jgi:hypothetical protein
MYINGDVYLMRFLLATKSNKVPLLIASMHQMIPLFYSVDRKNYAKYTPVYTPVTDSNNLTFTHLGAMELIEKSGMSVNWSQVPNSRNISDITISCTSGQYNLCTSRTELLMLI